MVANLHAAPLFNVILLADYAGTARQAAAKDTNSALPAQLLPWSQAWKPSGLASAHLVTENE